MRVLVTGATGFIGQALANVLLEAGHEVSALVRQFSDALSEKVQQFEIGDFADSDSTRLGQALQNIDVVIHAAARVHVMNESVADPLSAFRKVNVDFTTQLAEKAIEANVKRFIFLSSIKVNGESTSGREAFKESDVPAPEDAYGLSKYEAEQQLLVLQQRSRLELVILRLPLVYGVNVKGNLAALERLIQKPIPLPLGGIKNQRSMLALENLLSFVLCCLEHPACANQTFLLSDGEDVSTSELLIRMAKAHDISVKLIPAPVKLMRFVAKLLGREAVTERLFGSLQVDSSKARLLLDWQPVTSMQMQFNKMANQAISQQKTNSTS